MTTLNATNTTQDIRRWPRLRFSLMTLLLSITFCAVFLGTWQVLTYEPPTDRIPLYEKAPSTRGSWIDVGPNRVGIRLLARNDRDGSIHYENGRGVAVQRLVAKRQQDLVNAAPWLDVAEIEFTPTPDRLDIIEARIFDHKMRTLLSRVDPAFGWRIVEPDVIQVYGLGKKIPAQLDVWLRLQSYAPNSPVTILAPLPKSDCNVAGSTLTLDDIRDGRWSWSKDRLQIPLGEKGATVTAVFKFQGGKGTSERYQIAAVSKTGEKVHTDVPHYLDFSQPSYHRQFPIFFNISLQDLKHFEIRPFGGRHRFFFDSLTLPQVSASPFAQPPTAKVAVAGGEIESQVPAFQPLNVRISTYRGNCADGSGSNFRRIIINRGTATNLNQEFTLVSAVDGVALPLQYRFLKRGTQSFVSGKALSPHVSLATGGPQFAAACKSYLTPLDQIESIELSMPPP